MMAVFSPDEKSHLASKLDGGYVAYQKEFFAIAMNKALTPWFFIKDNALLFVRVFIATLVLLLLFQYIGDIYTEWELGTQAGLAAFLLMKMWFTYRLFEWFYPKGIVERAQESAKRFEEIMETKAWLKKPQSSGSGLSPQI